MKKLLSTVAIAALLSTSANATDNEIGVTGTVEAGAVVWIGDYQNTALVGGQMVFEGNTVAIGNMALGTTTSQSMPLSVKTNSTSGVKMTISDATNNGKLADGSKTPIDVAYKLDTLGALTLGTAQSIVTGTNDGVSAVDTFTATATVPADQESGDYSTTLAVFIEAN
ncbi:hypothetical protein MNB_SV-12-975 [hydrothermal vent metagenome]|uniref:Fimbrial protein n=1 Tax=hydrothermal vent metagenome TaxID=652676 RepID=A0A1W1BLJ2_9ZZZZ